MKKSLTNAPSKKIINKGISELKSLGLHSEKRLLSFSFLYFKQIDNFGIKGKDSKWTSGLLQQLTNLSEKTFDEIITNKSMKSQLRLHELSFEQGKTAFTDKDFSHIPQSYRDNINDCRIMQFEISKATGRVVGFFNEDHSVFYIVYLDPNHNAQFCSYNDYKLRPICPEESEIDDMRSRISQLLTNYIEMEQEMANYLLTDDLLFLYLDKDLLEPFTQLLQDGSFQRTLNDFLLDKL